MARLTSLLVLGAALGASAHPSRHGHLHNKARQVEKRTDGEWITAVIDGETVSWQMSGDYYNPTTSSLSSTATSIPTAVATPTAIVAAEHVAAVASSSSSSTAAAATSTGSSSSSGSGTGTTIASYSPFTELCGSSAKRATKEQIAATGNTGDDGDYGCNYAVTSSATVAEQYDNYVKFSGVSEDNTCYYWNKISKSGGINGWMTNEDSYWSFPLSSGETKYLVVDNGTYGGATCQPSSVAPVVNSDTGLLYTWIEWTFVDELSGWSDVDASSIQAELAKGTVNGLEVSADSISGVISAISPNAASIVNAFNKDLIDADGLGVQCAGPLKVNANFAYTG